MTKRFVTGSNGFIGGHLIERLGKMDGSTTGIEKSYFHGNHKWQCDQIFFLGTYGNMSHHADHYGMIKANVIDLLSVLKMFEGYLLYMSSSSVTLQVQTSYSRTKRAAEEILQSLPELKSCIVRPYSVTGVGEQKEHLIPTLIRSCMEGEEMPFDPYPVHDFIDVSDVVDALVEFSEHEHTGIFELGNCIPYTNQAVKEIVEETTGKKANLRDCGRIRKYDSSAWYCQKPSIKGKKPFIQSIIEMVEEYKNEHA